jgi:DNA transformation protein
VSRDNLVDHCLELMAPLGSVRSRRMFGGHGIYIDELFVAIIAYDRLYLKTDRTTRPQFEAAGCEPFAYDGQGRTVTLGYWTAPPDAMESPALMAPWGRLALQAALAARAGLKPRAARPRKRAAKAGR